MVGAASLLRALTHKVITLLLVVMFLGFQMIFICFRATPVSGSGSGLDFQIARMIAVSRIAFPLDTLSSTSETSPVGFWVTVKTGKVFMLKEGGRTTFFSTFSLISWLFCLAWASVNGTSFCRSMGFLTRAAERAVCA